VSGLIYAKFVHLGASADLCCTSAAALHDLTQVQNAFFSGGVQVIVATIAFGEPNPHPYPHNWELLSACL